MLLHILTPKRSSINLYMMILHIQEWSCPDEGPLESLACRDLTADNNLLSVCTALMQAGSKEHHKEHLGVRHSAEPLWGALMCLKKLIQNVITSALPNVQDARSDAPARILVIFMGPVLMSTSPEWAGQGGQVSRFYTSNVLITVCPPDWSYIPYFKAYHL